MKRLSCFVLLLLTVLVLSARADGSADDQYIAVYGMIQDADALSADHPDQALARYREAYTSLQAFQKAYPDWNDRIVSFRLSYLQEKIGETTALVPATRPVANAPAQPATTAPPPSAGSAAADRQMSEMDDQLKQLVSEKTDLQSKLKEAYATQPASANPHDFAVAQQKIQSLLRENALLKVSMTNRPAVTRVDTKALDDMRLTLADANRRLMEETSRANNLALERQVLLSRLATLASQTNAVVNVDVTQHALDNANQKLAAQADSTARMAQERDALLARVQELTKDAATAEALSSENEGLKQQLSVANARIQQQAQQLTEVQSHLTALQSEDDMLKMEKAALEDRVKAAAHPMEGSRPADLARISQLEEERNSLEQKLAAMTDSTSRTKGTAEMEQLSSQVNTLRAKLDVLQAHPIPYSPEELALFKKADAHLAANNADNTANPNGLKGEAASVRALPAGTAMLAAEAQRDFDAGKFDRAREKYQEILDQDPNNIYTLANLAAIELEMNDLTDADKHITHAIDVAPDDGYNLKILGYLRFREERYDEALDALSRAAKAEPQSAEIQNYLGVTLSHKGMRIPAETALRKAIELDPSYGNAHNNLAVIYATQQPPLLELARWHYQKALASGQPRNPQLEKLLQIKTD